MSTLVRRLVAAAGLFYYYSSTCCALSAARTSSGRGFAASAVKEVDYQPDVSCEPMVDFLKSQVGSNVQDVEVGISKVTGRRGLYARKTFKKAGAILCRIPSDTALALADPAETDQETPSVVQSGLNFLRMYYHNCHGKWWKSYLDSLPSRPIDTTPNMWTTEEINLLEFPRIVQSAKKRRQEVMDLKGQESQELLEYATWLVSSRAYPIRLSDDSVGAAKAGQADTAPVAGVNDDEKVLMDDRGRVISKVSSKFIPCLVPLIDMANHHSSQPNAKKNLIDPEKDEAYFALEALRPIKAGKEITVGYGSGVDSSIELLLNYGFVDKNDNSIDRFMLKKGGNDCIATLDGWTTTLEEDEKILSMLLENKNPGDEILKKILSFRIKLKKAYSTK